MRKISTVLSWIESMENKTPVMVMFNGQVYEGVVCYFETEDGSGHNYNVRLITKTYGQVDLYVMI